VSGETVDQIEEQHEEYFRVSSRHLMLASPWFKHILKNDGWSESRRSEEDGLFNITASDWDANAFLILLNIFHLRHRHIPKTISLEMLSEVAVLVDYYDCSEAVEVYTTLWVDSLKVKEAISSTNCRTLVLWIWTSWVFDMGDSFKKATSVAIHQTETSFQDLDVPLPTRLVGKLIWFVYKFICTNRNQIGLSSNDAKPLSL
jgi:hypothetical protein